MRTGYDLSGIILLFVIFIAFGAAARAGEAAQAAALTQHILQQGDLTREYLIYDPRRAGAAEPARQAGAAGPAKRAMVIVLHGGGGTARKFADTQNDDTSFSRLADREDILVVFPQGVERHWNDGRDVAHIATQAKGTDDVGFISALIDKMIETQNVDPARIYVTGPSNGGFMSNRLACDLSDKIAAVGIVIATMQEKVLPKCKPSHPVSVLIMNGTDDPLVPFDGGSVRIGKRGKSRGEVLSTAATFDFWLAHAGYVGKGADLPVTVLPDVDPEDKTRVYLQQYKGDAAEVRLYTIKGGGHSWPGARDTALRLIVSATSQDINATQTIWDFFKDKRRD